VGPSPVTVRSAFSPTTPLVPVAKASAARPLAGVSMRLPGASGLPAESASRAPPSQMLAPAPSG
jgi:hypothetical protein